MMREDTPQSEKLIVVLGSHRSGTSVTTRALKTMGVTLGQTLLPAEPMNAKGFFEDLDILALNQEMLEFLDLNWASLSAIKTDQIARLAEAGFRARAVALLRKKTADCDAFGIKDPRLTRLIEFWLPVFAQHRIDTRYVLALRNPASVASSLLSAHGMQLRHGYYLWLSHMSAAISHCEPDSTTLIDYDTLINEPLDRTRGLAQALEMEIDPDALEDFVEDFIAPELRTTRFDAKQLREDAECPSIVVEAFDVLQILHQNPIERNWEAAKNDAKRWSAVMASQRVDLNTLERTFQLPRLDNAPPTLPRRLRQFIGRSLRRVAKPKA